MRNFSNVTTQSADLSFYDIMEEYYKYPDHDDINVVLAKLAALFETDLPSVTHQFKLIQTQLVPNAEYLLHPDYQNDWSAEFVAPSEGRVLADLWNFLCLVNNHKDHSSVTTVSLAFNYVNLNTGRSLSLTFLKV